jgi:hypothetical protein
MLVFGSYYGTRGQEGAQGNHAGATFNGDPIEDPVAEFMREVDRVAKCAGEPGILRPAVQPPYPTPQRCDQGAPGELGDIYDLQQRLGHSSVTQSESYVKFLP